MRKILIVLTAYLSFLGSAAQPHLSWLNYSFSQRVSGIDVMGNDVWISTQGGLVKYNKITGEKSFYNRANSNLPDNNLVGLFCDTNGDVWVGGGFYGIGKFTGEQCTTYNQANSGLPSDQANSKIKIDKNGNVWIATFNWMAKYDRNNWKTWETGRDHPGFPIISDFAIDDKGVVWICSADGFAKIENDTYSIVPGIPPRGRNQCIEIDKNGNIWIGSSGVLTKYDGTTFTEYNTENSCLPSGTIYAISFDSANNMWLALNDLVRFDTTGCTTYALPPTPKGLEPGLIRIKCDNNDTIWCGTISGKLLCFDGTSFTTIELSNSPLGSNGILSIFVDEQDNKWIGTIQNTVKKETAQFNSVYNNQGTAFAQDKDGAIWTSFGSGDTCLLKTNGAESMVFDSLNSPFNTKHIYSQFNTKHIYIKALLFDNNNQLWVSTNGHGMFKYNGVSFTSFNTDNSNIPSNQLTGAAFDKNNVLWGIAPNGIFKFDDTNWTVWDTGNSAIPASAVNNLVIDSENKIWFATVGGEYGGGLTCFDGQTMKTYYMKNSGLQVNTISGISIDEDDKIWLATYGAGLISFDQNNTWNSYNVTNSGIANNHTNRIVKDKSGNFWIGHNNAGISVFNPGSDIQTLNNIQIKEGTNYLKIFPNPFGQSFYLELDLKENSNVKIELYDINGQLVYAAKNHFPQGFNKFRIDSKGLQNGIYFCKLMVGNKLSTFKVIKTD